MGRCAGVVAAVIALSCGDQAAPEVVPVDAAPDAARSSAKDITSFALLAADNPGLAADATTEIAGTTITANARFASDITALKATFSITGVDVRIRDESQVSGITINDFRSPVVYRVFAEDGSTQDYRITVRATGFSPKVDFATGMQPSSVAAADFNGDGKPDLAVANGNSNTVSILLDTTAMGSTVPSFAAKVDLATGVGSGPVFVSVDDFNGDGKPDLAVANAGSHTVSIFLDKTVMGAPTPSFSARVDFPTGAGNSIAIGDVNADGKPDLAVANFDNSGTVSVLLNTTTTGATTPSFAAKVDFATGPSPFSVAAADFNGDGKPDLAVSNVGGFRPIVVLLNTTTDATTPSFASKVEVLSDTNSGFITAGDLDGDGKPDLAVAEASTGALVLHNTTQTDATTPSFTLAGGAPAGASPSAIAIGDLDADGKPDLAIASGGSATVAALLNRTTTAATAVFRPKVEFSTGSIPNSVVMADFNADGLLDLAIANVNSGTVSVLLAR